MNCSITALYDGTCPAEECEYKVRLEILRGDMRFTIDAPFFDDPAPPSLGDVGNTSKRYPGLYEHECVEIFISSAAGDASSSSPRPAAETPYLEIEISPHGHYYMIAFLGQAQWSSQDDELVFETDPEVIIDRKNKRWYCKGSIPFFLLPEPGLDPADPLLLVWKINCVAIHSSGGGSGSSGKHPPRQYLSQNALPGNTPNFHQLRAFSPFVLSDKDSQRLRSISRCVSNRSLMIPLGLHFDMGSRQQSASPDQPQLAHAEPTMEQLLETIRARGGTKDSNNKYNMLIRSYLLEGEVVVLCSPLRKRKGWSHKNRLLVLTSKPRLIYFSARAPYAFKVCQAHCDTMLILACP